MTAARTAPRYAVIYDGNCSVCLRFVARLDRWDKHRILELVPSQRADVARRFAWFSQPDFDRSVQLVRLSDSKSWQGGAAIEELLNVLPRGRAVSWLFQLPFARRVAEKSYRAFALRRYRFGCAEHCRTT